MSRFVVTFIAFSLISKLLLNVAYADDYSGIIRVSPQTGSFKLAAPAVSGDQVFWTESGALYSYNIATKEIKTEETLPQTEGWIYYVAEAYGKDRLSAKNLATGEEKGIAWWSDVAYEEYTVTKSKARDKVVWLDKRTSNPTWWLYYNDLNDNWINDPLHKLYDKFPSNARVRAFNDKYFVYESDYLSINYRAVYVSNFSTPSEKPKLIADVYRNNSADPFDIKLADIDDGSIVFFTKTLDADDAGHELLYAYDIERPELGKRSIRTATAGVHIHDVQYSDKKVVWVETEISTNADLIYVLNYPLDADGDDVPDEIDNCILAANPEQIDSDQDGYGNACDPDFNNDGIIDDADYVFWNGLGDISINSQNRYLDIDDDGYITQVDRSVFEAMKGGPPGPSGFACVSEQRGNGEIGCDDLDGDGVPFHKDNCYQVANPKQTDTDLDGFGNACDADIDNDGAVSLTDVFRVLSESKKANEFDLSCDIDDDGGVSLADVFKALSFSKTNATAGPSGLTCANHIIDGKTLCADSDEDGVLDELDNCIEVPNGPVLGTCYSSADGQIDSDNDGFGNACDADVDNDGAVSVNDLALVSAASKSTNPSDYNESYDFDCDGQTSLVDVMYVLNLSKVGALPGPSGVTCNQICGDLKECIRNDYGLMVCEYLENYCLSNADCANNDSLLCNGQNVCLNNFCSYVENPCDNYQNCLEAPTRPEGFQCELAAGRCESLADCQDGLACNGYEICSADHRCAPTTSPCKSFESCREASTNTYFCDLKPERCYSNADCADDGLFCTSETVCNSSNTCIGQGSPCEYYKTCNENSDNCSLAAGSCEVDSDCADDGLLCNGAEYCGIAHTCLSAGTPCAQFEVCTEGASGYSCEYVDQIPTTKFTASKTKGDTNTIFTFDANSTSDLETSKDQLLFSWDWDGDGIEDTSRKSSNKVQTHQFTEPGYHHVFLFAEDSVGNRGMAFKTITVLPAPECGNFYCEEGENSDNCLADCPLPKCDKLNLNNVMINADDLLNNLKMVHPDGFQLNADNCVQRTVNCCKLGTNCSGKEYPLECIKDQCIVVDAQKYKHCVKTSDDCYYSNSLAKTVCQNEVTLDRLNACADISKDEMLYHFLDRMDECRIPVPDWCGFGCQQLKEKYCHSGYCSSDKWWFQNPAFCTNSSTEPNYDSQRAKLHSWLDQFSGGPNAYTNIINGCPVVGLNEDELALAGFPSTEISKYQKQGIFYIERLLAEQRPTLRATSIMLANYSWIENYQPAPPLSADEPLNWNGSNIQSPLYPEEAIATSEDFSESLQDFALNEILDTVPARPAYQAELLQSGLAEAPKTIAVVLPGQDEAFSRASQGIVKNIAKNPIQNALNFEGGEVQMITASSADTTESVIDRVLSAISVKPGDNLVYITNGIDGLAAAREIERQTNSLNSGGKTATAAFAPFGFNSLPELKAYAEQMADLTAQAGAGTSSLGDLNLWLLGNDTASSLELSETIKETKAIIKEMEQKTFGNTQIAQANTPQSFSDEGCSGARESACANNRMALVNGVEEAMFVVNGEAELASGYVSDQTFGEKMEDSLELTEQDYNPDPTVPFIFSTWRGLADFFIEHNPFRRSSFTKESIESLIREAADPNLEYFVTTDFRNDIPEMSNFLHSSSYPQESVENISNMLLASAERQDKELYFKMSTINYLEQYIVVADGFVNEDVIDYMLNGTFEILFPSEPDKLQKYVTDRRIRDNFVRFTAWHEGAHVVGHDKLKALQRAIGESGFHDCESSFRCTINEARADTIAAIKLYQYGLRSGVDTIEFLKLRAEARSRFTTGDLYHNAGKLIPTVINMDPAEILSLSNSEVIGLANKLILEEF